MRLDIWHMKLGTRNLAALLLVAVPCIGLLGCGDEKRVATQVSQAPLVAGADAETVKAVLYLRSPVPQKIANDGLLLASGETIEIERERLHPPASVVASILDDVDVGHPSGGKREVFEIVVDRKRSVVCLGSNCARMSVICPPRRDLRDGKSCQSFSSSHAR